MALSVGRIGGGPTKTSTPDQVRGKPNAPLTPAPRLKMSGASPHFGLREREKQRHEMPRLQLQKTKKRHWIPSLTGSPITNVGDKRRG